MDTIFRNIAAQETDQDREIRLLEEKHGMSESDPTPAQLQFSAQMKDQALTDAKDTVIKAQAENSKIPTKVDEGMGQLNPTEPANPMQDPLGVAGSGVKENLAAPAAGYMTGLAKGVGKSIENAWNLLDTVDNLGQRAFHQEGQGFIGRADFGIKARNQAEEFGVAFGQYVLPFLAGGAAAEAGAAATGITSTVAKGGLNLAANAVVNFAVGDPHGDRFLGTVAKHYPELKGPLTEWLNNHTGEGEIDGRLKNAIDGLIPDTFLAAGVWGVAKVIKGGANMFKPARVLEAEQKTAAGLASGELKPGQYYPANPIYVDEITSNAELRKILAEQNGTLIPSKAVENPIVKESLAESEKSILPKEVQEATKVVATVENPNPELTAVQDYVGRKASETAKIGPQTLGEMEQKGVDYVTNNPEEFAGLIKGYKSGDAISSEQKYAVHFFVKDLFDNMAAAHARAKQTGLAVDMAAAEKKMLEFYNIANTANGTAEASGKELRVLQAERTKDATTKFNAATQEVKVMGGLGEATNNVEKVTRMKAVLKESSGSALWGAVVKGLKNTRDAMNYVGLSGLSAASPMGNFISGTFKTGLNAMTDMNMFALGLAGTSETKIAAESAKASIIGNYSASKRAAREALHTMHTGETFLPSIYKFDEFVKTEGERVVQEATTPTGWAAKLYSSLADNGKNTWDIAMARPNKTQDAFLGMFSYQRKVTQMAVTEGMQRGLVGEHLEKWVAAREAAPSLPMHDAGLLAAKETTLALNYEEILGKNVLSRFAGSADAVLNSIGMAPVVPFMKAGFNGVTIALEHIPGLALAAPRTWSAFSAGGTERVAAIAKMLVGAEILGGAYALNHYANIKFTGKGPTDQQTMQALRQVNPGYQQDSIVFPNGQAVSLQGKGLLGDILMMYGDYTQLAGHLDDNARVQMAYGLSAILADTLTPRQITQDLPNVFDTLRAMTDKPDPDKVGKFLAESALNFVPASGILRSVRKDADPYKRETTGTTWDKFKNSFVNLIPGYSATLPPSRNLFGEVVAYPEGVHPSYVAPFYSSTGEDPLSKELMRLGMYNSKLVDGPPMAGDMKIEMPSKVFSINVGGVSTNTQLSATEYDQLVKFSAGLEVPSDVMNNGMALEAAGIAPQEANMFVETYMQDGTLKPLKNMLAELLADQDRQLPKDPNAAELLKNDDVKRMMVKATVSAYSQMGHAAMFLNPRLSKMLGQAVDDRIKIIEGAL